MSVCKRCREELSLFYDYWRNLTNLLFPIRKDMLLFIVFWNNFLRKQSLPEIANLVGFRWLILVAKLSDWYVVRGFKALKQTVKLHYRIGNYKQMMDAYREMLTYIKSAVTRNYSEKCINNILDFVSNGANQNLELLQEFYQTTLKALEEAKNEVNISP